MTDEATRAAEAPIEAWLRLPSPLGALLLAASARGLVGLWFDDQRHHPGPIDAPERPAHPLLDAARRALDVYWSGAVHGADAFAHLPLDARGSAFQRAVWQALRAIPIGATCSYGELAAAIGRPTAARAVGAAIGRNPLGIVVPCHRVVGRDGALTGYAGGLARKRALLAHEARSPVLRPAPAALQPASASSAMASTAGTV